MASEPEVPFDSGDRKAVKEKQTKAQREEKQRNNDMRFVMSTAEGRRMLVWLLEVTKLYHDTFSTNALAMANSAGTRKVGLILTDAMAAADPQGWVAMQLEVLNPNKEA